MSTGAYDYETYRQEITKIKNAENVHFWFKHRNQIIGNLFKRFVTAQDKCLEIGAGTGKLAEELATQGYHMAVSEVHPEAIRCIKARPSLSQCYQFDIHANPFKNEFDVVGMFDVLEHIEDDQAALKEVHTMLKPQGRLILSVPAHMWLWCRDDEASHHYRRYEIPALKDLLTRSGFDVVHAENRFLFLLPFLYIRAKFHLYADEIRISPLPNYVFDKLCWLENGLLKIFRLNSTKGGSIFLVARKI